MLYKSAVLFNYLQHVKRVRQVVCMGEGVTQTVLEKKMTSLEDGWVWDEVFSWISLRHPKLLDNENINDTRVPVTLTLLKT